MIKEKAFSILREKGQMDVSATHTYVTVQGFNGLPEPLKVLEVRISKAGSNIELLAEGKDMWITDSACIYNTAPRLYNGVLYAYEAMYSRYVLD